MSPGVLKGTIDVLRLSSQLPSLLGYACHAICAPRFRSFEESQLVSDEVYVIGSGPSLDEFDLGGIDGSTVMFLNSAIDSYETLPKTNQALWLCSDVKALLTIADRVPKDVRRIITVHRFDKALRVIRKLDAARDRFVLPKLSIRRLYPFRDGPGAGRLYFRPRYAVRDGKPVALRSLDDGLIYPATVMLLGIAVALLIARKGVHLVGFDMGAGPAAYSTKTVNSEVANPGRFPVQTIEWFLAEFRRQAEAKGVDICNHSPYAPEGVLRRSMHAGDDPGTAACRRRDGRDARPLP